MESYTAVSYEIRTGLQRRKLSQTSAQTAEALYQLAITQNRAALAKLISHIESRSEVAEFLNKLLVAPLSSCQVIGITGPPGSGKSTLLSKLVTALCTENSKIAVLLIDPSSPFSGGAILGDRLRLQGLVSNKQIYIRSFSSRGQLGGTTNALPYVIRLLESTGWTHIIVETVGVGQSELDIASIADTLCVVVNPGWGDVIQANKAGLMETADIFVINKSDRDGVEETRMDLEQIIQAKPQSEWQTTICETVATEATGIMELSQQIRNHLLCLEQYEAQSIRRVRRLREELKLELQTRCYQAISEWQSTGEHQVQLEKLSTGQNSMKEVIDVFLQYISYE